MKYPKYTSIFKPVNPDCRGFTECFECSKCKALIYTQYATKELDYNYCPYCSEPD